MENSPILKRSPLNKINIFIIIRRCIKEIKYGYPHRIKKIFLYTYPKTRHKIPKDE